MGHGFHSVELPEGMAVILMAISAPYAASGSKVRRHEVHACVAAGAAAARRSW